MHTSYVYKTASTAIASLALLSAMSVSALAADPVVSTNTGITLNEGSEVVIRSTHLNTTDPDTNTTPAQMEYMLVSIPTHGDLEINGMDMAILDTFTQEDINNGIITYHQDTPVATDEVDSFDFDVEDNDNETSVLTEFDITIENNASAPVINLNGDEGPIFRRRLDPIVLDPDLTITDADITTDHANAICGATITLKDMEDEDEESLNASVTSPITKSGSVSGNDYILTISGCGTIATYQTILRSVTYDFDGDSIDASPSTRDIDFEITDGTNDSSVVEITVTLDNTNYTGSIVFTNTSFSSGNNLKIKVTDKDLNRYSELEETIVVEIENDDSNERELVTLQETGEDTGIFEETLDTIDEEDCDNDEEDDNSGELCLDDGDVVKATYEDEMDSAGDTNEDRTDTIKEGTTSGSSGGGGSGSSGSGSTAEKECYEDYGFYDTCSSVFKTYIKNLKQDGIVKGYESGTKFKPGNSITRGELAAMVRKAFGFSIETTGTDCFKDVPKTNKFWGDIQALCKLNITKGYENRTLYKPEQFITRAETIQIIIAAMAERDIDTDNGKTHSFLDVDSNNKFKNAISFAATTKANGEYIVAGFDGGKYFRPNNQITRGEIAKMTHNAKIYYEENED